MHCRLLEALYVRGWRGGVFSVDTSPNYVPLMSPRLLVAGHQRLITTIYSPDYFYARLMTFLKEYRLSGPSPFAILHGRDIRAFFHSIWFLGFFGKERRITPGRHDQPP